ncbi:hypothetical protein SAMN05443663_102407 [Flavobacterium defluvii]|uniref:Uncharacterized protein n=1 Tax=Flavobacterium defluvii TaxID=370979 RepID=A0A1M5IJD9_9FLAO|nr:hypothetical protein SAMN05443663_102407 [Flavobacterium defluvii]
MKINSNDFNVSSFKKGKNKSKLIFIILNLIQNMYN